MVDRTILRSGAALAPPGFMRPGELAVSPGDNTLWVADAGGVARRALAVADLVLGGAAFLNVGTVAGTVLPGDAYDGAWTLSTPTVTSSIGTLTSVTCNLRTKKIGRITFIRAGITITLNGSGAGAVLMPLPFAAAGSQAIAGKLGTGSAALLGCVASGSSASITRYDGVYPGADATTLLLTGLYEATS